MTAVPDRSRRLADGALVDGSIRARLLGLRVLTLDATIVLLPADVTARPPAAQDPPAPTSAPPSGIPRPRPGAAGHALAEAVRRINEGSELLADAQRRGE